MNPKKWSHRTRALVNLAFIGFAILVGYLKLGMPYLTNEQADYYSLRHNLASQMEPFATIPLPIYPENPYEQSNQQIYLFRHGDTISATISCPFSYPWPKFYEYVIGYRMVDYENRDGMAIIPLDELAEDKYGHATGAVVAAVPTNHDIVRIEVTYSDGVSQKTTFPTEERYDGVFVATCAGIDIWPFYDIYDDWLAYDYFGAVGYDAEGNIIAETTSFQEELYETR